jgi:hypothetical protein
MEALVMTSIPIHIHIHIHIRSPAKRLTEKEHWKQANWRETLFFPLCSSLSFSLSTPTPRTQATLQRRSTRHEKRKRQMKRSAAKTRSKECGAMKALIDFSDVFSFSSPPAGVLNLHKYGIQRASLWARFCGLTALEIRSMTVWLAGRFPGGG